MPQVKYMEVQKIGAEEEIITDDEKKRSRQKSRSRCNLQEEKEIQGARNHDRKRDSSKSYHKGAFFQTSDR